MNQKQSVLVEALLLAPAGLSLSVLAHLDRSCSTRSLAMNLPRSGALYATRKPTFPATRETFGLKMIDSHE